jgi:adenine-specific DNA-methyltransferase
VNPYYEDEDVTLYHGRCEEVLPTLEAGSFNLLLTDPPYFEVKDDEWDNQWDHAAEFLGWLGGVLDAAKPALTANASAWVFAGPALASQVEAVVRERFRVLNQVRWVKEQGWHQKADIAAQRRFLTPWEAVIFAEQDLSREAFAMFGGYIRKHRERAGLTMNDVDVALGYVRTKNPERGTELCRRWEEGSSLPTEADYLRLRAVLGAEFLVRDYAALRAEHEAKRRPFALRRAGPVSDVWNFDTVAPYAGKHPCEKPQALLRHMIDVSSRPGDLILDPFAGSGSTLVAARDAGRRAVGVEMDLGYCRRIADRLSQGVLDFGEPA